jgi:hypothetical protein
MEHPTSDNSCITMRAKNATAHPEVLDQTVKRKHCTKAQIEADNKVAEKAKAAEEAKRKAGLKKIVNLERKLDEEDLNDVTPKAEATLCCHPLRHTSSHLVIPLYADKTPNFSEPLAEQTSEGTTDEYEQSSECKATNIDEGESAPLKKKTKPAKGKVREAIKTAR